MKNINSIKEILNDFNYETNSFNNDFYKLNDGKNKTLEFNDNINDILFNFKLSVDKKNYKNDIYVLKLKDLHIIKEIKADSASDKKTRSIFNNSINKKIMNKLNIYNKTRDQVFSLIPRFIYYN